MNVPTFPDRPRVDKTLCCRRRTWQSRCGSYRVVQNRSLFGLPDVWRAMVFCREYRCWDILSAHRKPRPAFAAVQRHARRQERRTKKNHEDTETPSKTHFASSRLGG